MLTATWIVGYFIARDFMLSAIVWTKLSIYVVPVIFKLLLYACICCALFKAWLETLALCFIVSDVGIITFNIGKTYIFVISLLSLRDSNKLFLPYTSLTQIQWGKCAYGPHTLEHYLNLAY
ncbi:hypothetical protein ACJX0J_023640, partial [Zea mays]